MVLEGVWNMCYELGGMEGAMVGVSFFNIDSEVWDVHLGENLVDVFGLWK